MEPLHRSAHRLSSLSSLVTRCSQPSVLSRPVRIIYVPTNRTAWRLGTSGRQIQTNGRSPRNRERDRQHHSICRHLAYGPIRNSARRPCPASSSPARLQARRVRYHHAGLALIRSRSRLVMKLRSWCVARETYSLISTGRSLSRRSDASQPDRLADRLIVHLQLVRVTSAGSCLTTDADAAILGAAADRPHAAASQVLRHITSFIP